MLGFINYMPLDTMTFIMVLSAGLVVGILFSIQALIALASVVGHQHLVEEDVFETVSDAEWNSLIEWELPENQPRVAPVREFSPKEDLPRPMPLKIRVRTTRSMAPTESDNFIQELALRRHLDKDINNLTIRLCDRS